MAVVAPKPDEEDNSLMPSVRASRLLDGLPHRTDPTTVATSSKRLQSKKAVDSDEQLYEDIIRRTQSKRFGKYPLLKMEVETQTHTYDPYSSPPIISQAEIHAVGVQLTQKANRVGKSGDSDFKERCMCCGLSTVCSLTDY